MTVDEGQKVIEDFKSQGKSDEEIAGAFFLLFRDGKIDVNGLEGLVNLLGYRLDDEFKAMPTEDQKKYGYEVIGDEDEQEASNDEQEDNAPAEEQPQPQSEEPKNDEGQSEEDEEKKGMNLLDGKDTPELQSTEDNAEEEEARKLLRY